jgi:hypothetical protein
MHASARPKPAFATTIQLRPRFAEASQVNACSVPGCTRCRKRANRQALQVALPILLVLVAVAATTHAHPHSAPHAVAPARVGIDIAIAVLGAALVVRRRAGTLAARLPLREAPSAARAEAAEHRVALHSVAVAGAAAAVIVALGTLDAAAPHASLVPVAATAVGTFAVVRLALCRALRWASQ